MSTLLTKEQSKAAQVAKSPKRHFEETWSILETRHGWRITEEDVLNPDIKIANVPYAWQDYDNRHAKAFREKHQLEELIEDAASDWEAILRLRHWAFMNLRDGKPSFPIQGSRASEVVDASLSGATFYCTYFAHGFVAAATSVGFLARHLGVDGLRTSEERGTHHGVADVWVDSLRKWVHLDPNYDHHYELNGVPLSAEELGQCWRKNQGEGVKGYVGPERRETHRPRAGLPGKSETACFYWHYIDTLNDVFNRTGRGWPDPVVFLVDEERKKNTWLQGQPPDTFSHGRYSNGTFLQTERYEDAYPDMNCTKLEILKPQKVPYVARMTFGRTYVPNLSHHHARTNGGPIQVIRGEEYPWQLILGTNELEIRAVNLAGREGPPSRIRVRIEEDGSRKPTWPECYVHGD